MGQHNEKTLKITIDGDKTAFAELYQLISTKANFSDFLLSSC
jgi:hypothetical protein